MHGALLTVSWRAGQMQMSKLQQGLVEADCCQRNIMIYIVCQNCSRLLLWTPTQSSPPRMPPQVPVLFTNGTHAAFTCKGRCGHHTMPEGTALFFLVNKSRQDLPAWKVCITCYEYYTVTKPASTKGTSIVIESDQLQIQWQGAAGPWSPVRHLHSVYFRPSSTPPLHNTILLQILHMHHSHFVHSVEPVESPLI